MKVLVTGGLGYIGSHTVVELQNKGYDVCVVDNLSNSKLSVLDGIEAITKKRPQFFKLDLRDKECTSNFFNSHQDILGVIHFAGSKAVGESVLKPHYYYENNIVSLLNTLDGVSKLKHKNFVFSSSCSVYGNPDSLPIKESAPVHKAESPYGKTKQISEALLNDIASVNQDFKVILLRYFNPIGAHNSAHIGELPIGTPQNLIPYITQSAIGLRGPLSVFGNDYSTPDGTCIRDYIHIEDIAKAHIIAFDRIVKGDVTRNSETYNLGTGQGHSVLEVIAAFEEISGHKLDYKFAPRRKGDVTAAFADTKKANSILGWKAQLTLHDAMTSAWKWQLELQQKK